MTHRIGDPTSPPTPVTDDAHASAAELHARAAADYAAAQAHREATSHRTGGN